MSPERQQFIVKYAQRHLDHIIEDALQDYSHWDGDQDFTEEDYDWMYNNIRLELKVRGPE